MTTYETIHITPSTKSKLQEIRVYEFGELGTMEQVVDGLIRLYDELQAKENQKQ